MASCLDFGKHGFIGVIAIQVDGNAGFFGEFFQQFWVGVVAPVLKVKFSACGCCARCEQASKQ